MFQVIFIIYITSFSFIYHIFISFIYIINFFESIYINILSLGLFFSLWFLSGAIFKELFEFITHQLLYRIFLDQILFFFWNRSTFLSLLVFIFFNFYIFSDFFQRIFSSCLFHQKRVLIIITSSSIYTHSNHFEFSSENYMISCELF